MRAAKQILEELDQRDLLELCTRIARQHHLTVDELVGSSRVRPIPRARRSMWLELYEEHGFSSIRIGALFGYEASTVTVGLGIARRERTALTTTEAP